MLFEESDLPRSSNDEKKLLLDWLGYLRGAILRKVDGLDDAQAHWTPGAKLLPLIGIVNHLTKVEWRWIDGGFGGAEVSRDEQEFNPEVELTLSQAVAAYRQQATDTDARVLSLTLSHPSEPDSWAGGRDLRWVVLHLINETARHAGHADATRELLDGSTGE